MIGPFQRIGIFTKPTGADITETLQHTCKFLQQRGHEIVFDPISNERMPNSGFSVESDKLIGGKCDLVLVLGGDGSLLKAARAIVDFKVPILGINRGNLGFLADVAPDDISTALEPILSGEYHEEERSMLNATIVQNNEPSSYHVALNDVVIHHGDIARLIEFTIYINNLFVVEQRADGVITSTPTGSTAYALSGGGPIVYPTLDVITLMPMFPHALNTRPIVIEKHSKVKIIINARNSIDAKFSCDGQTHVTLSAGDEVIIKPHKNNVRLLHPKDYNYFAVLREKLGWNLNPKD